MQFSTCTAAACTHPPVHFFDLFLMSGPRAKVLIGPKPDPMVQAAAWVEQVSDIGVCVCWYTVYIHCPYTCICVYTHRRTYVYACTPRQSRHYHSSSSSSAALCACAPYPADNASEHNMPKGNTYSTETRLPPFPLFISPFKSPKEEYIPVRGVP